MGPTTIGDNANDIGPLMGKTIESSKNPNDEGSPLIDQQEQNTSVVEDDGDLDATAQIITNPKQNQNKINNSKLNNSKLDNSKMDNSNTVLYEYDDWKENAADSNDNSRILDVIREEDQ